MLIQLYFKVVFAMNKRRIKFVRALKTKPHVVSNQKLVLKAHELINQRTASGLDMNKLFAKSNVNVLPTNEEGVILLDKNNQDHMRWLED